MKGFHKVAVVLIVAFLLSASAAADGVYITYTYDYWGNPQYSPDGYEVESVVTGQSIGVGAFKNPQDIFIDSDGDIYIADTENSRVIICDKEFRPKRILTEIEFEGAVTPLAKPTGLFVSKDKELYIADEELKIVFRCDISGKADITFRKPDKNFEFTGIDYIPRKVVADTNGFVYILCKDMYHGAMMYEHNGDFVGYYGANKTKVTLEVLSNYIRKRFMTKEQRAKIQKAVPVGMSNFDIDSDNFIYTCTSATVGLDVGTEQIRKLNPKSINVLPKNSSILPQYKSVYGDLKANWASGRVNTTTFADVVYDEEGYINCIDDTRGRIFQYDEESNLLFAFGNDGDQKGTFQRPIAIECYDGRIYVLDCVKLNIVILKKTQYCEYLHSAVNLYREGRYADAEYFWNQVLKLNSNFHLAYVGIGKIKYEQEDYPAAMDYFRIGEDREQYGKAFKQYRTILLRLYIIPIVLICIAGFIVFYLFLKAWRWGRKYFSARKGQDGAVLTNKTV